jgi:homoserine dehydrogenase
LTTHPARERALTSTVTAIKELDAVTDVVSVLRVEGN